MSDALIFAVFQQTAALEFPFPLNFLGVRDVLEHLFLIIKAKLYVRHFSFAPQVPCGSDCTFEDDWVLERVAECTWHRQLQLAEKARCYA